MRQEGDVVERRTAGMREDGKKGRQEERKTGRQESGRQVLEMEGRKVGRKTAVGETIDVVLRRSFI